MVRSFAPMMRTLGIGVLAGLGAGVLVGGLGARIVMRVAGALSQLPAGSASTSNGNLVGNITLDGTLGIVSMVGLPAGVLGGVLYTAMRRPLLPAAVWRGALFGVVSLALVGSTVLNPANVDFRRFGPVGVNVVTFSALFVLFGIAIAPLFDGIERRSRAGAWDAAIWSAAFAGVAALLISVYAVLTTLAGLDRATADDRDLAAAFALMLLVIAACAARARLGRFADVAIAALVVVGAYRTLTEVAALVA